jgi:fructose transport system substrate-binding protein
MYLPQRIACAVAAAATLAAAVATSGALAAEPPIIIGLVTKTDTNPFFVKMKEGAMQAAEANGVRLLTGAGRADGDNAGQITAIETMVAAGAKTILLAPNDAKAIVHTIRKAREKGVMFVALDSPTEPQSAVDALFATDNYKAGVLIGQYAKASLGNKRLRVATLDLFPGHPVSIQRRDGFLNGLGLRKDDPSIVCQQDSYGNQAKGQTAMENCLQKNPEINLVYAINEPAAAGAYKALKAAGRENSVMIVSVDGGCSGVRDVKAGRLAATSQQYPLRMAALGVEAGIAYARTGKKASGYVDTGVVLITDKQAKGIDSRDTQYGLDACWGKK